MKKIKNIPEGSFYVVNKRPSRNGFYVYVEIDGKAYVMEMINCLDDDVMLDSEGRDRLLRKLSGYDDELYIDALTGISNRRYFEDQIRKMKASAGVAMIDLDDFKIYNDTFGHDAGDLALTTVVGIVKANVRRTDMLIRMGDQRGNP